MRAGKPSAVDAPGRPAAIAVSLTYDLNGDTKPDAAIEVLIPRTGIDLTVTRASRWIYGMAAFVLIALFLILFMIRRNQNSQDFVVTHDGLTGLGNRALLHRRGPWAARPAPAGLGWRRRAAADRP